MNPENEEYENIEEEAVPIKAKKVKPTAQPEVRYVPYHHPEETGIVDTEKNVVVGNDLFVLLSRILNELDEIKKSVG